MDAQHAGRIARLRSNAAAADAAARMRREEADRFGALTAGPGTRAVEMLELKLAVADAAQEQADLARAKLITAIEATDPDYLTFLESYTYASYLADSKIGPLEAWRQRKALKAARA